MKKRRAAALALAAWAVGGCLGFDRSPLREPCVPGSSVSCTCADRSLGTALCLAGGRVGECSCENTSADGFAGVGSGTGGAGAGTSGPIASAGAGGAGGASGVGGSAGGTTGDGGPSGIDASPPGPDAGIDTGVPTGVDSGMPPAPHPDLYKPCYATRECGGGLACAPIDTGMGPAGYCSELCATSVDCTQPSSGDAQAACVGGQCLLQCTLGVVCPVGMMCLVIPPFITNGLCYYP